MKSNERLIHFFEVTVGTNKQAASPPALLPVVQKLKEAVDASAAVLLINKQTAYVEIAELKIDEHRNLATMFIRFTDKNGPDVYFNDPVKKASRVERKRDGEGRAIGTHFCVSLIPRDPGSDIYPAILERASNLSSSIIIRLLQGIIRNQYKENPNLFTCDDISGARTRDGRPKQVGFRPMLELSGLPSDQFIADLEGGTLKEVLLIEQREGTQVGARPWLVEDEKVTKLSARAAAGGIAGLWENLKLLFLDKAREGITRARVKFKRADGQPDTVDIDPETGGLLDQRYIKAKKLSDIAPDLDECADGIVQHFASLIEAELIENR